jgi:hypothetical protein
VTPVQNVDGRGNPGRSAGLELVRSRFAGALADDEVLIAAVATTPFRLTVLNSLIATAKDLVGQNQARILLLSDRSIHICSRRFSKPKLRKVLATYPIRGVPVGWAGGALVVDGKSFYMNNAGYQVARGIGNSFDVDLFVAASS